MLTFNWILRFMLFIWLVLPAWQRGIIWVWISFIHGIFNQMEFLNRSLLVVDVDETEDKAFSFLFVMCVLKIKFCALPMFFNVFLLPIELKKKLILSLSIILIYLGENQKVGIISFWIEQKKRHLCDQYKTYFFYSY